MNPRASHLAAGAGLLATLLLFAVPEGLARSALYNLLAVIALGAMAVGIRRNRPEHALLWWLLLAGNGLLVAGDLLYSLLEAVGEVGDVSIADPVYLAAYPAMAAGLYLTIRVRTSEHRSALVDAVIFGLSGGAALWANLIARHISDAWVGLVGVVTVAYPVMDLAVLVLLVRLGLDGGWRLPAQRYAVLALLPMLAADLAYTEMSMQGTYQLGGILDAAWVLSYICWSAAALHPSMRGVASPIDTRSATVIRSHVGALVLAAILVVAVAVTRDTHSVLEDLLLTAVTSAVVILSVVRLQVVSAALRVRADAEAERARRTEARLAALIERAADVIFVVDDDRRVTYASPAVERVLGWKPEEVVALPPLALLHPDDHAFVKSDSAWQIARHNRYGEYQAIEVRLRHRRGDWRTAEVIASDLSDDPAVRGVILNLRDITDRKHLEAELTRQALHDPLTGLANRVLFTDRLARALRRRAVDGRPSEVAVLFCDLDDFKFVNDTFGHVEGDRLLEEIATRLTRAVRLEDTVARLGGDEFAVLIEDVPGSETVERVATSVVAAVAGRHTIGDASVFVTLSVGVTSAVPGTTTAELLMREADAAMYGAKDKGKNTWSWFDAGMYDAVSARLHLENDLRLALELGQLEVHYQPIVSLPSGSVSGAEALVRWQHPTNGLVSPAAFLPIAEETGLVVPLGWWVLETACVFAQQIRSANPNFIVSVNLSAVQLSEEDLVERVAGALAASGLPAEALTLELTETAVASDSPATLSRLHALKELGLRLAIDDFGTGYSALSYLQRLPVDVLKVDKSFVDGIGEPDALVPTILGVAKTLGLATVAEGVEHQRQAELLAELGCERAQGYFFGRPLTADSFLELLGRTPVSPNL